MRLTKEHRDFHTCIQTLISTDPVCPPVSRPDNETIWAVQPRATLADVIRATLERYGWTKTQFASHMGVYASQVSHWLSGAAKGMAPDRRAKLRNLLRRYSDLDRMFSLIDWPTDQRKRQH